MLDFSNAKLNKVILHKTGNKAHEEQLVLSDTELMLNDSIMEMLKGFFLGHFSNEAFYNFTPKGQSDDNEVYTASTTYSVARNTLFLKARQLQPNCTMQEVTQKSRLATSTLPHSPTLW